LSLLGNPAVASWLKLIVEQHKGDGMNILKAVICTGLVLFAASCGSKTENKKPTNVLQGDYKNVDTGRLMKIEDTTIGVSTEIGLSMSRYIIKSTAGNQVTIEVDNPKDTTDPTHPKNTIIAVYLETDGFVIKDKGNFMFDGHWKRLGR